VPPHPFLGRVIYTQDPGRTLVSGKCNDGGAIVMQQFRGLAARAPYFSNGSAANLREPVVLPVLPELDATCNTLLPAEERHKLTFEPPRPPNPSGGPRAFADALPAPAAAPARAFTLRYDFTGLIVFRHAGELKAIFAAAKACAARRIAITGYRGSVLLSDGSTLVEQAGIARRRAEQVAELLRGAGLTDVEHVVRWDDEAGAADGDDAALRRVTVELDP
jgi:hypothetical protein